MTSTEASVTSDSGGFATPVVRASVGGAGASALAAFRTGFESLAWFGCGHGATLAAMGCLTPLCASLFWLHVGSDFHGQESVPVGASFVGSRFTSFCGVRSEGGRHPSRSPAAVRSVATSSCGCLAARRSEQRGSSFRAPPRSDAPTLAQVR